MNNLLGSEKPVPLEFLINGSYLRTSIDDYLTVNGLSAETTLAVEYVRALIPPTHVASFEHDDWVSSVDVLSSSSLAAVEGGKERILSSCYDGYLRIWNTSSRVIATSPDPLGGGHASSIRSAKFLSPTQLVSSGLDRTIRLWQYNEEQPESRTKISPKLELYGHRGSVDSIAVHGPSNRILSASADHTIGLWSTRKTEAPEAPKHLLPSASARGSKQRKLSHHQTPTVPQRGSMCFLKGHTEAVSETVFDFRDRTVCYSVSWDHSVRTWDLVTSAPVDTRTTSSALLSLTQLHELNLLATGSSGKDIKLIDPRDSATTVSAITLRGHFNAVASVARDPESEYGLVSGSHDGTCRVWDVRSIGNAKRTEKEGSVGESIYTIERESVKGSSKGRPVAGEGVKVFGVCWDRVLGIVSASEDKRVQINRGSGVVSQDTRVSA